MSLRDAILLAAAELPDPGALCTITFLSVFGAFAGQGIGRMLGRSPDRVKDLAFDGGFVGFALGVALWWVAFTIDRL